MSQITGLMIQSALGKMADDLLAQEQFHIRVSAETGRVTVLLPFCHYSWKDMDAFFADPLPIPPYGRVWVHIE